LSGVEKYMTPSTTSGVVSNECGMPVSYFQASRRREALDGVICRSGE
jgi:hypothetical protein